MTDYDVYITIDTKKEEKEGCYYYDRVLRTIKDIKGNNIPNTYLYEANIYHHSNLISGYIIGIFQGTKLVGWLSHKSDIENHLLVNLTESQAVLPRVYKVIYALNKEIVPTNIIKSNIDITSKIQYIASCMMGTNEYKEIAIVGNQIKCKLKDEYNSEICGENSTTEETD